MSAFDIIIAILTLFFIFIGIKRGLIGEVVRLIALLSGLLVAFVYFKDVTSFTPLLKKLPLNIGNTISFAILFVITSVIVLLIGWIISKVVHHTPLGIFDRIFGAVIGIIKAAIITWVICLSIASFPSVIVNHKMRHSVVYTAYKSLPATLRLHSILELHKFIRKTIPDETPKKIKSLNHSIESLRMQVDSAKNSTKK